MALIKTEKKQENGKTIKYDYYDNNTVEIYEYCGCSNPWKLIRKSTWSEVNGVKVIH